MPPFFCGGVLIFMEAIKINNLSKIYQIYANSSRPLTLREKFFLHKKNNNQNFEALKNINLVIEKGEILGIIGKNGAGKSTMLKILAGITPPSLGRIEIKGRISSLLEVGTGFHPELTGRENIFLNGSILGLSRREVVSCFDEIVEFSGIGKFLDVPVKKYSSGMYVRLAFSVAAHLQCDILLLDEVLAVGDIEFQNKCLNKIREFALDLEKTIIFVSHSINSIQNICKKCLLLENGRIEKIGLTDNVVDYYLNRMDYHEKIKIEHRRDRKGTGKIIITDIKITNNSGSENIKSGDGIKFIIGYKSEFSADMKNVRFFLKLFNNFGLPIAIFDTTLTKDSPRVFKPSGKIVCQTDPVNISEGQYYIDVAVFFNGQKEDHIMQAATLLVNREDKRFDFSESYNGSKLMLIKHSFFIE